MTARVALVFDREQRPETTGTYCLRAMAEIAEVAYFAPSSMNDVPKGYDLYLLIDDGLDYLLPNDLRPRAYWAIDTHLSFGRTLSRAKTMDFVFAAQKDGTIRLREEGIKKADWLPLACDPSVHTRHEVDKQYDVGFVGNVFPGARADLLQLIQNRFAKCHVGRAYFEEMASVYSASRMVFNRSIRNDVNMRVFEALACGSLLATNDLSSNGLSDLFQDGSHLVTYRDADDLLALIEYFLDHEVERERIAEAGRAEALANHTYRHRMQQLLAIVGGGISRTSWLDGSGGSTSGLMQDPSYYEHVRPELLDLVPNTARWVLDIGCGAGSLGAALKRRQEVRVVGVEMSRDVAKLAQARLDEVYVGDVETLEFSFADGLFDAIVCGDVLEHLRDPAKFLSRARDWLSADGRIVASIPNARNHSLVGGLLQGNWTYQTAGLLDRTHLRFFTRREIEKLFFRAGYRIDTLGIVPGPGYQEWHERGEPGEVPLGPISLTGLSAEEAAEFYAYQYLVSAQRARRGPTAVANANGCRPVSDFGLTSIVVLTHNQLGYTRQCLASLAHCTDEAYQLIVVDNGSTDGTPEYLRSLPNVKLIENAVNRGFPAAANQGMQAAKGRQILLLNNDTVVTTGWLWRLLDALYSEPMMGIVGPSSNMVSGPQQVPIAYRDLDGLDGFAWEWGRTHHRKLEDAKRLVGFCLLIRREVIDRIGLLDEQFGIGTFEDDDYCLRTLVAGYRLAIVRGAFVHHFGSATFNGSGVDGKNLLEENRRRFDQKWAGGLVVASAPASTSLPREVKFDLRDVPGRLLLTRSPVTLSLCMIVRNNERTLGPALASIYPWVDEIVVVDTGSTDATIAVAESYGTRIHHFPWCDDFSAARNESIRHATGDWLFWMDSDDTIRPEEGRKLRGLIESHHDERILGYIMQVHCPGQNRDDPNDMVAVDHLKLFRNRPDVRFEGRIHEQLLPSIRQAGGVPAWTDGYVVHSGSDKTPEGMRKKVERDLRILHKDLEERPDHPFVLFNLGMTYADVHETDKAVAYFRRCLEVSARMESHVRKAHALLVTTLIYAERNDEAWGACQAGLADYPDDRELLFLAGSLNLHFGRLRQAEQNYRLLLDTKVERHFTSVMKGLDGFRGRHNLARVYEEMGNDGKAEVEWRAVVAEAPEFREGWRNLADNLLRQRCTEKVAEVIDRLQRVAGLQPSSLQCEAILLRARHSALKGDPAGCEAALREAVRLYPDDVEAIRMLSECYNGAEDPMLAAQRLEEFVNAGRPHAVKYYYLGMAYFRCRRLSDAAQAYQASLDLEPNSGATFLWLGHALRESGASEAARAAYIRARDLAKNDPALRSTAMRHLDA